LTINPYLIGFLNIKTINDVLKLYIDIDTYTSVLMNSKIIFVNNKILVP